MGINNLQLSTELIAALYPDSLVRIEDSDPPKKKVGTKKPDLPDNLDYPFLGKNLRSICFLVFYPDEEFIPGRQLVFLQKILSACKCSMDDIALINASRTPVKMDALRRQFNPRIIFLWGAGSVPAGILEKFPDMVISTWENILILPVQQANQMSSDLPENQELKRNLWVSLKKLFSL